MLTYLLQNKSNHIRIPDLHTHPHPSPLPDLDAPKDLEASQSTETTLTIVWKKPVAKISVYRLIYFSADGSMEEVEIPATETTYTLTKLTPGMLYTMSLVAKRGSEKSEPTTLSTSTGELHGS